MWIRKLIKNINLMGDTPKIKLVPSIFYVTKDIN